MIELRTLDVNALQFKATHYTGEFGRKSRRKLKILERDHLKCVTCGRSKNLTIAHITPIRKQSRGTSTYKLDNCRILCVECHNITEHQIDGKVNYLHNHEL